MKKSDIAMIILIASIFTLASFLIANQISWLKPNEKGEEVQVINKINPSVPEPDAQVFQSGSINPTVQTVIGGGQASQ